MIGSVVFRLGSSESGSKITIVGVGVAVPGSMRSPLISACVGIVCVIVEMGFCRNVASSRGWRQRGIGIGVGVSDGVEVSVGVSVGVGVGVGVSVGVGVGVSVGVDVGVGVGVGGLHYITN
ncbi:hypothetical protein BC937DRAFT_95486 [Endogone sp. FLAS-F59071]|nr:hypothetical protein BC937DRAFT_95486 [Endogone sp. FLAS-F59071]|eukprot:RUS13331.1 hypothetical protein BC937DRAFT_95486 [Endogone sp. FLAS-F59071]